MYDAHKRSRFGSLLQTRNIIPAERHKTAAGDFVPFTKLETKSEVRFRWPTVHGRPTQSQQHVFGPQRSPRTRILCFNRKTMEKFTRVEKRKEDIPIGENEVRVTAVGRLYNYVNYAATLYNVCPSRQNEEGLCVRSCRKKAKNR